MRLTEPNPIVKLLVLLTYIGMVAVNAMANILPINGITTGDVSDAYPNLFAPAGVTFAIWGLIYLLLAVYAVYQLGFFQKYKNIVKDPLLNQVGILFSISSLANIGWIFAWHYRLIPYSMALMGVILLCLSLINHKIRQVTLTSSEKLMIRLPFSVYFGWITVATIANATTLLVDMAWNRFGLSEVTWTVAILIVGILIGVVTTIKNKDIAYGLVLVWAYGGILLKHLSQANFNFQYPPIVYTAMACIVLVLLVIINGMLSEVRQDRRKIDSL